MRLRLLGILQLFGLWDKQCVTCLGKSEAVGFEQFILGNRLWMFPKIGVPPKSSILIGFSIINHPFWGKHPYFWKHPNRLVRRLLGWAASLVILDCPFQPPGFWAQVPSPCLNPLLQWTLWCVLTLGVRLNQKLPTGFSLKDPTALCFLGWFGIWHFGKTYFDTVGPLKNVSMMIYAMLQKKF